MLSNLKKKLFPKRYLSPWLILMIDVACSVVASFLAMFFIMFMSKWKPEWMLSISWLAISAVISLVCFKLLKTNRTIIRHSTLRDLARIFMAVVGKSICVAVVAEMLFQMFSSTFHFGVHILLVDLIFTFGLLMVVRVLMIWVYDFLKLNLSYNSQTNTLRVCEL